MGKVTKSIEIEASPEKVFAFMCDLEKMNEITKGSHTSSFVESVYTSKGPIGVGTTRHTVGKFGGQRAEFDMEITEFEKNKKLSIRTIGSSKFKWHGTDVLETTAKGTKLTSNIDYEPPYSVIGKIIDKLWVHKDIEKGIERSLNDMKKALET